MSCGRSLKIFIRNQAYLIVRESGLNLLIQTASNKECLVTAEWVQNQHGTFMTNYPSGQARIQFIFRA